MAYQAKIRFVLPILIITLTLMLGSASVSCAYDEIIDRQAGIRVSVLPISLARGHQARFRVWIETGSGEIDQKIIEISSLADDQDRVYSPIRTKGFQAGMRQFHGDLFFPPIGDDAKAVTLTIKGVGGAGKREFEWKLER